MPKRSAVERVYCNECRSKTLHQLVKSIEDQGSDDETGYSWSTAFDMMQCRGCQDVILRRTFRFSEDGYEPVVRYFPPPMSRYMPSWRFRLPISMRPLLEEIYRSLDADNLRLPLMGARSLLDMVMLEKVGDTGGFMEKLKALEGDGYVSSQNRVVLLAALDMGSAAVHRGHRATESEIQAVMDIVENLLQAIYVLPAAAKKLKDSTPPRVTKKPNSKAP